MEAFPRKGNGGSDTFRQIFESFCPLQIMFLKFFVHLRLLTQTARQRENCVTFWSPGSTKRVFLQIY